MGTMRHVAPNRLHEQAVSVHSVLAFGVILVGALAAVAGIVLGALALVVTLQPALMPTVWP